jgi:hypothetical protein
MIGAQIVSNWPQVRIYSQANGSLVNSCTTKSVQVWLINSELTQQVSSSSLLPSLRTIDGPSGLIAIRTNSYVLFELQFRHRDYTRWKPRKALPKKNNKESQMRKKKINKNRIFRIARSKNFTNRTYTTTPHGPSISTYYKIVKLRSNRWEQSSCIIAT